MNVGATHPHKYVQINKELDFLASLCSAFIISQSSIIWNHWIFGDHPHTEKDTETDADHKPYLLTVRNTWKIGGLLNKVLLYFSSKLTSSKTVDVSSAAGCFPFTDVVGRSASRRLPRRIRDCRSFSFCSRSFLKYISVIAHLHCGRWTLVRTRIPVPFL